MNNLMRRRILQGIVAAFGTSILASCGCDTNDAGGAGIPPPDPLNGRFLLYSETADPRILGGILDSGEKFTLSGEKSDTGEILLANEFSLVDAKEKISTVQFAEGNRVIATNHLAQLTLSQSPSGALNLGLLAGDQQLEISLPEIAAPAVLAASSTAGRSGQLVFGLAPMDCQSCTGAVSARPLVTLPAGVGAQATVNAPIVDITVTGCPGTNPRVFVYMRDETGKLINVPVAKPSGKNTYSAVLAHLNTSDEAFAEAAQEAQALLEEFDIFGGAFLSILEKLKTTSIDAVVERIVKRLKDAGKDEETIEHFRPYIDDPDDIDFVGTLEAKFKRFLGKSLGLALKAYDIYGKLMAAVQGGLTFNAWLDAYSQLKYNRLQLQAVVKTAKGEKFVSVGTGLILPEGPYPGLTVEVPGAVELSGLTLMPPAPVARQTYRAEGTISCLVSGDVVTISVVGTDGYTNAATTVANADGNQSFALVVPGGESGVSDVVTLRVSRAGAEIGRRTASLVFT